MSDSHTRNHEALRKSDERYRVLFDLSPVAVYSIDASGVIQEFNRVASELWGREPASGDTDERFCGSFKMFRTDGTFMPHEQCPMAQVVNGEILEAPDAEVLIERPDGSRVTVVVNIRPLKDSNGDITGASIAFMTSPNASDWSANDNSRPRLWPISTVARTNSWRCSAMSFVIPSRPSSMPCICWGPNLMDIPFSSAPAPSSSVK